MAGLCHAHTVPQESPWPSRAQQQSIYHELVKSFFLALVIVARETGGRLSQAGVNLLTHAVAAEALGQMLCGQLPLQDGAGLFDKTRWPLPLVL